MRQHAALATRLVSPNVMPPRERDDFMAMVEHGLKVAGAKTKLLSDQALELLWRTSHGLPRAASKALRAGLTLAHEREQAFVDEQVMLDACEALCSWCGPRPPSLGLSLGAPAHVARGASGSMRSMTWRPVAE